MRCPKCNEEVGEGLLFCTACKVYIANPALGIKASFMDRFAAHVLSSMLFFAVITYAETLDNKNVQQLLLLISYSVFVLYFYAQALSPGKYIVRLRVIDIKTNKQANLNTMLLREIIGKLISGLPLSLGYLWSLNDKNMQTWHDLLFSTVVVKELALESLKDKSEQPVLP